MLNLHTHDQASPSPRRKRTAAFGSALAIHAALLLALLVGAQRAHLQSGTPDASGPASGPLTYVMPAVPVAPPAPKPAEKALPVETKVEPAVEPSGAAVPGATATQVTGPVRVGSGDLTLLRKIKPVYPAVMQSARREGVVVLDATILRDGSIGDVKVLSASTAFFETAAIAAVKQWRYAPPPFEALVTVTVNFTLS